MGFMRNYMIVHDYYLRKARFTQPLLQSTGNGADRQEPSATGKDLRYFHQHFSIIILLMAIFVVDPHTCY